MEQKNIIKLLVACADSKLSIYFSRDQLNSFFPEEAIPAGAEGENYIIHQDGKEFYITTKNNGLRVTLDTNKMINEIRLAYSLRKKIIEKIKENEKCSTKRGIKNAYNTLLLDYENNIESIITSEKYKAVKVLTRGLNAKGNKIWLTGKSIKSIFLSGLPKPIIDEEFYTLSVDNFKEGNPYIRVTTPNSNTNSNMIVNIKRISIPKLCEAISDAVKPILDNSETTKRKRNSLTAYMKEVQGIRDEFSENPDLNKIRREKEKSHLVAVPLVATLALGPLTGTGCAVNSERMPSNRTDENINFVVDEGQQSTDEGRTDEGRTDEGRMNGIIYEILSPKELEGSKLTKSEVNGAENQIYALSEGISEEKTTHGNNSEKE